MTLIGENEETNRSLLGNKSGNGLINNNLKAFLRMEILFFFHDAFVFVTMATKQRLEVNLELGWRTSSWTEQFFFFFTCSIDAISLARNLISWQSTGGVDSTLTAHPLFLMHSCCAVSLQSCCQSVQSHMLTPCTCMAQVTKHIVCVSPKNTPHRAMSYTLPHLMTPSTGTPSLPFLESVFQRAGQPCEDRRPQVSGASTEQSRIHRLGSR